MASTAIAHPLDHTLLRQLEVGQTNGTVRLVGDVLLAEATDVYVLDLLGPGGGSGVRLAAPVSPFTINASHVIDNLWRGDSGLFGGHRAAVHRGPAYGSAPMRALAAAVLALRGDQLVTIVDFAGSRTELLKLQTHPMVVMMDGEAGSDDSRLPRSTPPDPDHHHPNPPHSFRFDEQWQRGPGRRTRRCAAHTAPRAAHGDHDRDQQPVGGAVGTG